jgi:DNA-binding transcriptional MerR regulator/methylmalonyl-CoA mutase cobalamin-binding subunit
MSVVKPIRTIKLVARETGLSVHTIRVWERRYRAVTPVRAGNNRRLYTEKDVERLRLLHEATRAGHSIGQIARASIAELRQLVRGAGVNAVPGKRTRATETDELAGRLITAAITATESFDGRALLKLLDRAAVDLGSPAVLQKFIAPLAERVGDLWRAGDLTVAHEHFVTNQITDFLGGFARPYSESMTAPHLVLATPTGQLHELGAVIVAAAARSHGWRTTYLGAALPIEEFAGAVENLRPRAVGLSIVYPPDDEALRRDLRRLPGLLPKGAALLVGGRSAAGYAELFREIKATHVATLADLYPALDALQHRRKATVKARTK